MKQHAGAAVEKAVRRSGISIAELARRVRINRRSIYNWFEQEILSVDIIFKIGNAISYDFTADFPDLLPNYRLQFSQNQPQRKAETLQDEDLQQLHYWKDKYITLLEKYNQLLVVLNKAELEAEETAA